MIRIIGLLLTCLLASCSSVAVVPPPVPVLLPAAAVPPVPAPVPVVPPVAVPAALPPLEVLDSSAVSAVIEGAALRMTLVSEGTWLRLRLPDGRISPITTGPDCECIGLGGDGPHALVVGWLPGLSVETALDLAGPWTVAAKTH